MKTTCSTSLLKPLVARVDMFEQFLLAASMETYVSIQIEGHVYRICMNTMFHDTFEASGNQVDLLVGSLCAAICLKIPCFETL
jgi:hypothetical protein